MYVFFLLLAMLGFAFFYKRREGMTAQDPSAMVQQQQGQIEKIKEQVDGLTLSQSVVDQLQDLSDTNDENTGTLQSLMGQTNATSTENAYPDES
jgi:hypothetical protein